MATEKIRIKYEVDKKQLEDSNKALEKSVKENNLVQKEVDQTTDKFSTQEKQLSKTNTAFRGVGDQLKSLGNRFTIAGKGVGDLGSGLLSTARGAGTATKAMKILKVAIASTGIGLLVVALGSLVTFFTKTQRGADIVSKAMAVISTTVDVVIDRVSKLGEGLFKVLRGDFSEGLKILKNSFKGLGDEIARETEAAINFERRSQDLIKSRRSFLVEEQKLINQIAKARLEAEEAQIREGETAEEANQRQVDAIRRAIALEKNLASQRETLAKENLDIISGQVGLGESLNEELDAQAEAERELLSIQGQRDQSLKALTARETSLTGALKEQKAAMKAAQEGSKELTDEEKKAVTERLMLIDDELEKRGELLDAEGDLSDERRIANAEFRALTLERNNEFESAEILRRDFILENEELTAQEREQIIQDSEDRIHSIRLQSAQRTIQTTQTVTSGIFATLSAFSDMRIARLEHDQERELEMAEGNEEEQEAIRERFAARLAEERRKAAVLAKAANIIQATQSTALAVVGALGMQPFTPFNIVLSSIMGALGAAQVAAIAATPIPTFEVGGRIGGKRHSQGGTLIEAETGEHVMNRKATGKYGHDIFDKINRLELDPNVLNGNSGGSLNIIDTKPIADALDKRPVNEININEEGFIRRQIKNDYIMKEKLNRYST